MLTTAMSRSLVGESNLKTSRTVSNRCSTDSRFADDVPVHRID
jgi:hypothetical protein